MATNSIHSWTANAPQTPELRAEVVRLLRQNKLAGNFLQEPIVTLPDTQVQRALVPGEILGQRFVIDRLLGVGGMGEVYLARDNRLRRLVAVKLLPPHALTDSRHRHRLEREARAIASLSHPHICSLYHLDTDSGRDYLVLEYLQGQTLAERLKHGPLPLLECRQIADQLIAALGYAHKQGIIHRDLKPGNIMLTVEGAKLLDFGIAKQRVSSSAGRAGEDTHTALGSVVGTVSYMSPEQAQGQTVDFRSDIFSFGCVLYEMITGLRAFDRGSNISTLAAVLNGEPAPIREILPHAPPELEQIVASCLKKNPLARPQSMSDLGQALSDSAWTIRADSAPSPHQEALLRMPAMGGASPAARVRQLLRKHALLAGGLSCVISVVAAIGIWQFRASWQAPASIGSDSIVILPFSNLKNDPDLDFLADGLSESITNDLSRVPALRVIARTTAFKYKGHDADVRNLSRDLKVRLVATGAVSRNRDLVDVQADLVSASDGTQIWGQEYRGTIDTALAVRKDIVRNLTTRLRVQFSDGYQRDADRNTTQSRDAYQLYLQGRYALGRSSVPEVNKSIDLFHRALEIDPTYALAYSGLADSFLTLSGMYLKSDEAMMKARAAAERASQLDPDLADAHVSIGVIDGWHDFEWAKAAEELRRACEVNPNSAAARLWYAWNFVLNGRFREGIAQAELAHQLDPLSAFVETGLAQMYSYAGQREKAIQQLRGVVQSDPGFFNGHHYLGTVYLAAKQYREAISEFKKATQLDNSQPQPIAYLAYAHEMIGEHDQAKTYLHELKESRNNRYVSSVLFAIVFISLNDYDGAMKSLDEAYQVRDDMLSLINVDEIFAPLRADRRFAVLLANVGFAGPSRMSPGGLRL